MTSRTKDLTGLIVGPLKVIEPTEQRDSSKCTVWKAECVCGEFEYGSRTTLEKFAGHRTCPGHPVKGKELPVEGFALEPELRDTDEQARAREAWEAARRCASGAADDDSWGVGDPPSANVDATPEAPAASETPKPAKGSTILRDRLGLDGYCTEHVTLQNTLAVAGGQAKKVVFAKATDGDDRVLLHIELDMPGGTRTTVSAMKKLSAEELANVTAELEQLNIAWRMKEVRQRTKKTKQTEEH